MRGFVLGRHYIRPEWITGILWGLLSCVLLLGMWEGYKVATKVRLLRQQLENLKQEAAARQVGRDIELVGHIQNLQNETDLLKVQLARVENDVQRLRNQAANVGNFQTSPVPMPTLAPAFQAQPGTNPAAIPAPLIREETPPFTVVRLQFIGEQKLAGHIGLRNAAMMTLQNQESTPLSIKVVADRAVTNFVMEPLGLRDDILFRANRNDAVYISAGTFSLELRVP